LFTFYDGVLNSQDITHTNEHVTGQLNDNPTHLKIWKDMPNFTFMGYSLGLAYADSRNGDNVVSAMIGGMVTVRNGAFPMHTGDLVQFYFDGEEIFFDDEGQRKVDNTPLTQDPVSKRRRTFHDRQLGTIVNEHNGKKLIAFPKPFMYAADGRDRLFDKRRIFGKAVSNARAWDMVDLLISRQSI
jgi:hypothetical protein